VSVIKRSFIISVVLGVTASVGYYVYLKAITPAIGGATDTVLSAIEEQMEQSTTTSTSEITVTTATGTTVTAISDVATTVISTETAVA